MRLHRFFVHEQVGDRKDLLISHGNLVNQLKNVFRLKNGDKVIIFDNSGRDFYTTITGYEKDMVSFHVDEVKENSVSPKKEIYLFSSIVKKDTFEWIVEKATELGVSHIIPIISERSEKKSLNIDRLQKIIVEAAEQSGRATLPTLHDIKDLPTALKDYANISSIAFHTEAPRFVSQELSSVQGVYIGPEGGWSDREVTLFKENKIQVCSLGPQVLRAETAVVAALAQLVF